LHGTGRTPPPDETHTLVITSHFRDFLYCIDPVKCLGYSEETYVETIKFTLHWVPASKVSVESMEPSWDAQFTVTDDTSTVSFDGKWKACP
jgi:hypothetical protein